MDLEEGEILISDISSKSSDDETREVGRDNVRPRLSRHERGHEWEGSYASKSSDKKYNHSCRRESFCRKTFPSSQCLVKADRRYWNKNKSTYQHEIDAVLWDESTLRRSKSGSATFNSKPDFEFSYSGAKQLKRKRKPAVESFSPKEKISRSGPSYQEGFRYNDIVHTSTMLKKVVSKSSSHPVALATANKHDNYSLMNKLITAGLARKKVLTDCPVIRDIDLRSSISLDKLDANHCSTTHKITPSLIQMDPLSNNSRTMPNINDSDDSEVEVLTPPKKVVPLVTLDSDGDELDVVNSGISNNRESSTENQIEPGKLLELKGFNGSVSNETTLNNPPLEPVLDTVNRFSDNASVKLVDSGEEGYPPYSPSSPSSVSDGSNKGKEIHMLSTTQNTDGIMDFEEPCCSFISPQTSSSGIKYLIKSSQEGSEALPITSNASLSKPEREPSLTDENSLEHLGEQIKNIEHSAPVTNEISGTKQTNDILCLEYINKEQECIRTTVYDGMNNSPRNSPCISTKIDIVPVPIDVFSENCMDTSAENEPYSPSSNYGTSNEKNNETISPFDCFATSTSSALTCSSSMNQDRTSFTGTNNTFKTDLRGHKENQYDNNANKNETSVKNECVNVTSEDDDVSQLRMIALSTKGKINPSSVSNKELVSFKENISQSNTSADDDEYDDEDEDILQLRVAALKSAVMKKHEERKRRGLLVKKRKRASSGLADDLLLSPPDSEKCNKNLNNVKFASSQQINESVMSPPATTNSLQGEVDMELADSDSVGDIIEDAQVPESILKTNLHGQDKLPSNDCKLINQSTENEVVPVKNLTSFPSTTLSIPPQPLPPGVDEDFVSQYGYFGKTQFTPPLPPILPLPPPPPVSVFTSLPPPPPPPLPLPISDELIPCNQHLKNNFDISFSAIPLKQVLSQTTTTTDDVSFDDKKITMISSQSDPRSPEDRKTVKPTNPQYQPIKCNKHSEEIKNLVNNKLSISSLKRQQLRTNLRPIPTVKNILKSLKKKDIIIKKKRNKQNQRHLRKYKKNSEKSLHEPKLLCITNSPPSKLKKKVNVQVGSHHNPPLCTTEPIRHMTSYKQERDFQCIVDAPSYNQEENMQCITDSPVTVYSGDCQVPNPLCSVKNQDIYNENVTEPNSSQERLSNQEDEMDLSDMIVLDEVGMSPEHKSKYDKNEDNNSWKLDEEDEYVLRTRALTTLLTNPSTSKHKHSQSSRLWLQEEELNTRFSKSRENLTTVNLDLKLTGPKEEIVPKSKVEFENISVTRRVDINDPSKYRLSRVLKNDSRRSVVQGSSLKVVVPADSKPLILPRLPSPPIVERFVINVGQDSDSEEDCEWMRKVRIQDNDAPTPPASAVDHELERSIDLLLMNARKSTENPLSAKTNNSRTSILSRLGGPVNITPKQRSKRKRDFELSDTPLRLLPKETQEEYQRLQKIIEEKEKQIKNQTKKNASKSQIHKTNSSLISIKDGKIQCKGDNSQNIGFISKAGTSTFTKPQINIGQHNTAMKKVQIDVGNNQSNKRHNSRAFTTYQQDSKHVNIGTQDKKSFTHTKMYDCTPESKQVLSQASSANLVEIQKGQENKLRTMIKEDKEHTENQKRTKDHEVNIDHKPSRSTKYRSKDYQQGSNVIDCLNLNHEKSSKHSEENEEATPTFTGVHNSKLKTNFCCEATEVAEFQTINSNLVKITPLDSPKSDLENNATPKHSLHFLDVHKNNRIDLVSDKHQANNDKIGSEPSYTNQTKKLDRTFTSALGTNETSPNKVTVSSLDVNVADNLDILGDPEVLTSKQANLLYERFVLIDELTEMNESLSELEQEQSKLDEAVLEISRLHSALRAAEEKLHMQHSRTQSLEQGLYTAHQAVYQRHTRIQTLETCCQQLGTRLRGQHYKIPSTGKELMAKKIHQVLEKKGKIIVKREIIKSFMQNPNEVDLNPKLNRKNTDAEDLDSSSSFLLEEPDPTQIAPLPLELMTSFRNYSSQSVCEIKVSSPENTNSNSLPQCSSSNIETDTLKISSAVSSFADNKIDSQPIPSECWSSENPVSHNSGANMSSPQQKNIPLSENLLIDKIDQSKEPRSQEISNMSNHKLDIQPFKGYSLSSNMQLEEKTLGKLSKGEGDEVSTTCNKMINITESETLPLNVINSESNNKLHSSFQNSNCSSSESKDKMTRKSSKSIMKYKSVLQYKEATNSVTPPSSCGDVLCPYDLGGKCQDKQCKYQHLS